MKFLIIQNFEILNYSSEDFSSIYALTPSFLKLPPPFTQPLLFRAQFLPPPFKPILKKFYPLQYEGGGANYD